ncbi:MAG: DUF748 domain-containing protein [Campylobacterota bacterium]
MSRFDKVFYFVFIVFTIYVSVGFKLIPYIAQEQLVKNLNNNLTLKTHIEKVDFNPFTFSIKIDDFKLGDYKNPTISFQELILDVGGFKSLLDMHVNIENITLKQAFVDVIQYEDDSINLTKLLKQKENKPKQNNKNSSSDIKFLISKISLLNSNINFTKQKENKPFLFTLDNINYTIHDLGTFKNPLTSNNLSIDINKNAKLILKGALRLEPFSMYGKVSLSNLELKKLLDYKKEMLNFTLDKNANFDTVVNFDISKKDEFKLKLNTDKFLLSNLNINSNKNSVLKLEKFDISKINFDLNKQDIKVSNIEFTKPEVNLIQDKDGLNISNLINKTEIKDEKNKTKQENTNTENNWDIMLSNIKLNNSTFKFEDKKNKIAIDVNDLIVNLNSIKLIDNKIDINKIVSDTKSININQIKQKQKINIKDIGLDIEDIYLNNQNIDIEKLQLSKPSFKLENQKTNSLIKAENIDIFANKITKNEKLIKVDQVKLNEPALSIYNSKDKTKINTSNINIIVNNIKRYDNGLLSVGNTNIKNPKIEISLLRKTQSKTEPETKKSVAKKEDSPKFDIGTVSINNAQLQFEDENLPIPFKTTISKLNGEISKFDTTKASKTDLKVNGVVNKYGIAKITGIVNPQDIKILTDINMIFKNISMKSFTPYTSRYIGRQIDGGKLDLNLKYNIEKSNLDAKNSIVITKIELGDEVKSDDAVSLPLGLAIALLENRNGVIDLDIPVSGNIDDPKFEIGSIVWKAFSNLIMKAVTAPFSLLGAMFGFDENEIKSVSFDYGQKVISPLQKETLDKITKILKKRPNLALKLSPTYDKNKDLEALQIQSFKEFIENKIPNKQIENYETKYQTILEKQYLKYNKNLDIKNQFVDNKKLNYQAYTKRLKEILLEKQNITKKDLEKIGKSRVKSIKDYLIQNNKVGQKQVIIQDKIDILNNSTDNLNISIELSNIN